MKKCCKCKLLKEIDKFAKNKSTKDGLQDYCKHCWTIYCDEKRADIRRNKKKYRDNNKLKRKIDNNEYRAKNRERMRYLNAKNVYGLTEEEYYSLLAIGKCQICERTENNTGKAFAIDHCHKTGKIRGILCDLCNRGLGYFKDNVSFLEKAINYLNMESK